MVCCSARSWTDYEDKQLDLDAIKLAELIIKVRSTAKQVQRTPYNAALSPSPCVCPQQAIITLSAACRPPAFELSLAIRLSAWHLQLASTALNLYGLLLPDYAGWLGPVPALCTYGASLCQLPEQRTEQPAER